MQETLIRQLRAECRPLLNKFYRGLRSHMRAPAGADYWVVGDTEIIGGLCLTDVADGQWLTGLMIAPHHRNQGLATRLLSSALGGRRGTVWLFCEPELMPFYERVGFGASSAMPASLASRLDRYNRHKTLQAMQYPSENQCLKRP